MQYEALIRDAWRLTWRFRSLWVLGLFAGGSAGPSCSWSNPAGEPPTTMAGPTAPRAEEVASTIGTWVAANVGLIVVIAAIVGVLVLVSLVISLIAQGGLTRAGADAAAGGAPTLGAAWGAGLRSFWRYLGLALLVVALAIGLVMLAAIAFAIVSAVRGAAGDGAANAILTIFLVLPLGIAGLVIAFALASTVTFAQRAIVLADVGPADALRRGWLMFREHITNCAVLWILSIALGIAAAIAVAIVLIVGAIPFVIVGVMLWFGLGGPEPAFVAWVVLGVAALIVAAFLVASMLGTFFWHYWTLAYLRLSGAAVTSA